MREGRTRKQISLKHGFSNQRRDFSRISAELPGNLKARES